MHSFPVHSERLKPERGRRERDEFQEESKGKKGKK
jgi:hypothetical protein